MRLHVSALRSCILPAALAALPAAAWASPMLSFSSAQEGVVVPPAGVSLATLVPMTLGTAPLSFANGVSVSFANGAQVVNGDKGGQYAMPIQANGQAYTGNYYSTELGSISFHFASTQTYLGLLWGSLDSGSNGNVLTFYKSGVQVGRVTGADMLALAGSSVHGFTSGYQGFGGSFFLNVYGVNGGGFDAMTATSLMPSFEFAAVTVDPPSPVPEPASVAPLAVGLLALAGLLVRRRTPRRMAPAA